MIDKATNDYYDAMFDMFTCKGWNEFIADMEFALDALDNIEAITDEKQLFTVQGQIKTLKSITGFQSAIEASYEDLKDDS
jgi:hypothetical protein